MEWLQTSVILPEDPQEITDAIRNELKIITSMGSDESEATAIKRYPSFRTRYQESRYGTKSRYSLRLPLLDPNTELKKHLTRVFNRQATAFSVRNQQLA